MQFVSYSFIFVLLPITCLLYFLFNRIGIRYGKFILIISSLLFYTGLDIKSSIPLCLSIAVNAVFAYILHKRREKPYWFIAYVPIITNILILVYFKYTNFILSSIYSVVGSDHRLYDIVLPVGISFFTFQQIAYLVELRKGNIQEFNISDYLCFILYFPKLLMGPLMDPVDFISQINDPDAKRVNWENIACGLKILSFGLVKKVVLADAFSKGVTYGFANYSDTTPMDWAFIILFYTFEIYFDFSGYCDMATGISLMLNIRLPINFDSPYRAVSVRDFWKRWHISLTQFFTKYVYFPLGGNRKGKIKTYLNVMIVFLISGLWHGANWTFVLWGALHGLLSVIERIFGNIFERIPKFIRWVFSFSVVSLLWLLFRSESITQWVSILKQVLCLRSIDTSGGVVGVCYPAEIRLMGGMLGNISIFSGFDMNIIGVAVFMIVSFAIVLFPSNNYRKLKNNSFVTMAIASLAFVYGIICISGESVFVYQGF